MVYQVSAGYSVLGRLIKVPQVFIDKVIRVIIMARTAHETDMLNVLHVAAGATPVTAGDVVAAVEAVAAWVAAKYHDIYADAVAVEAIHGRSMEGLDGPQFTVYQHTPGTLTGDVMPYDTTLPVEWGTLTTGIASHGAFFPFPPTEAQNTVDGSPSAAYVDLVQTTMDDLRVRLNAAHVPLIVASFTHTQYKQVQDTITRAKWGVQERRRPAVG